jgi:dienelactone hydrolase
VKQAVQPSFIVKHSLKYRYRLRQSQPVLPKYSNGGRTCTSRGDRACRSTEWGDGSKAASATWVRDAGFTVYMPSLFGRDGAVPDVEEGAAVFQRACVSAEFRALAANQSSPVTQWLRALASLAHQQCGGQEVGAIGMCFTGNLALTMMLEPAVLAPVLSQPALPLNDPAGIEIAPEDIKAVRDRLDREDLTVLAYRFEGDRICRAERFAAYVAALGDRFVGRVLPDSAWPS